MSHAKSFWPSRSCGGWLAGSAVCIAASLVTVIGLAFASVASAHTDAPQIERACVAPCYLTVEKYGTGTGFVTSERPGIFCGDVCFLITDYDERMTLRATPDSGSVFTGWAGDCERVAGGECFLHFDIAKHAVAIFDRAGAPPSTYVPGPGPGDATPPVVVPPPAGCTIGGTAGDDVIHGTSGKDVICGLGGNDHIHGEGGNDVIRGGGGNDEVEGDGGNDRVYGGAGNDRIFGNGGRDTLTGGTGRDRIDGGAAGDSLRARDGSADAVRGGAGRDAARADRRDTLQSVERRYR